MFLFLYIFFLLNKLTNIQFISNKTVQQLHFKAVNSIVYLLIE